jgi:hypothetical protein
MFIRLTELTNRVCAANIRDDYRYWNTNGERGPYGKLLPIDLQDHFTQHIFFDDNVQFGEEESGCSVDVRDVVSGEHIPIAKSAGKFAIKVDTFKAIVDFDYFSKELDAAE